MNRTASILLYNYMSSRRVTEWCTVSLADRRYINVRKSWVITYVKCFVFNWLRSPSWLHAHPNCLCHQIRLQNDPYLLLMLSCYKTQPQKGIGGDFRIVRYLALHWITNAGDQIDPIGLLSEIDCWITFVKVVSVEKDTSSQSAFVTSLILQLKEVVQESQIWSTYQIVPYVHV